MKTNDFWDGVEKGRERPGVLGDWGLGVFKIPGLKPWAMESWAMESRVMESWAMESWVMESWVMDAQGYVTNCISIHNL